MSNIPLLLSLYLDDLDDVGGEMLLLLALIAFVVVAVAVIVVKALLIAEEGAAAAAATAADVKVKVGAIIVAVSAVVPTFKQLLLAAAKNRH